MALGAWLGGNGALMGASANLVVAGFAECAGQPIGFVLFMRSCFVPLLLSAAIAHVHI